ncbi:MAG: 2,3-bisphosphoglycerate-dependent phosphoglycerate mutase, partial [Candidatus Levybacteria bacterium]|nr:2,3-bisphosphoglycerate-dependent phosphoglycerate mutase [Candidatus Levybacteria bacterium]
MNEESQATHLVLVRHGLSQYNEKGLWAGWADTPLTQKGREEAKLAAGVLHGMNFQAGYTSPLSRAKETLEIILRELSQESIPIETDAALNERNYGIYTG